MKKQGTSFCGQSLKMTLYYTILVMSANSAKIHGLLAAFSYI